MKRKFMLYVAAALLATSGQMKAGELMDRLESGQAIRIGFANEPPLAYPDENSMPAGYVNAFILGVLNEMGYDNIESVVTDWGGLVPGLQAGRIDAITGGMYITEARCRNILFSDPVARVVNAFLVKKGNPDGVVNFESLIEKNKTMVTGAGYMDIAAAKNAGVPEASIMVVPGQAEIMAAVLAGRASAGSSTLSAVDDMVKKSRGELEATDPDALPEEMQNWIGIGFRPSDADFVEKFNAAVKDYMGSPAMMAAVSEFGYVEAMLPADTTLEWVCQNR